MTRGVNGPLGPGLGCPAGSRVVLQFAFRWVGLCSKHLCPRPRPAGAAAAHSPNKPQLLSSDRVGVRVQRPRSEVGRTVRTARRPVDDDSNSGLARGRRSFVVFGDSQWRHSRASPEHQHEAEPGYLALAVLALARLVACSPCDEANGFIQKCSIQRITVKLRSELGITYREWRLAGKTAAQALISHIFHITVFELNLKQALKSVSLITVGQISPVSVTVIGPLGGRHRLPLLPQHLPPHHQQKIAWPLVADAVSAF